MLFKSGLVSDPDTAHNGAIFCLTSTYPEDCFVFCSHNSPIGFYVTIYDFGLMNEIKKNPSRQESQSTTSSELSSHAVTCISSLWFNEVHHVADCSATHRRGIVSM